MLGFFKTVRILPEKKSCELCYEVPSPRTIGAMMVKKPIAPNTTGIWKRKRKVTRFRNPVVTNSPTESSFLKNGTLNFQIKYQSKWG